MKWGSKRGIDNKKIKKVEPPQFFLIFEEIGTSKQIWYAYMKRSKKASTIVLKNHRSGSQLPQGRARTQSHKNTPTRRPMSKKRQQRRRRPGGAE
jgi:hypothetical protein